jgi:GTPase KRas
MKKANVPILLNLEKITIEFSENTYELQLSTLFDTGLTDEEQENLEKSDGFMIVFDTTNKFSLEKTQIYKKKIDKSNTEPPMVLIGNKCDLKDERQVSTEEGLKLANDFKCAYFETCSVGNYKGVDEAFKELIKSIDTFKKKYGQTNESNCLLM